MTRGSEHLGNYESQNVVSKITKDVETVEVKQPTLAEQMVEADLRYFSKQLTPKLNEIRESIFYKTPDTSGRPLQIESEHKKLEVVLANIIYETKNIPKGKLIAHLKQTIEDVYSPQLRALEQRKITLETFLGTPDERSATEFLWKCKHFIQELEYNIQHFVNNLKKTLPEAASDRDIKQGYLAIADSMWKSAAAFADPTTWFQEFVDTMAKNEQDSADSVLNELKIA